MIRFLICVTILPMIMGLGFMRLKKERGTGSLLECYMLGLLFLFLLGEAASCAVIKLESGFSFYCRLFAGCIGVGAVCSLLFGGKMIKELWRSALGRLQEMKELCRLSSGRILMAAIVLILIVLPVAGYFLYVPDTGSSTMVETISVTTSTGTIFGYNPVTGTPLEYGMYPIYKFACLPLIYSALYEFCQLPLSVFAYYAIPIWLLLVTASVLLIWSELVFRESREKKYFFLLVAGLLLVTGNGESGSFASGLLHGGFKGEVAAAALAIPFCAYMLYQLIVKKEWWYGLAGTGLSLCGVLVMRPLFLPDSFAYVGENSGKEWTLLALSVFVLYLAREKTRKKWKKQEAVLLGICLFAGIVTGEIFALMGTAYAGTCLWGIAEERKKAVPMIVGMVLLIALSGTVLPLRGVCAKKADVAPGDVEIQDRIAELAEDYEKEVVLVAPEKVMEQARLQNSKVVLPYGKDLWQKNCNREIADDYTEKEVLLFEQMKIDYTQPDTVAVMAAEMHCNILVMRERMSEEVLIRGGWKEAEDVTGYAVYYK